MGIALRRVSDGEYLLFDQRADNGQSNTGANWAAIGWDDTEIGAAISGDSPTETYQIDLIDAFAGGWGVDWYGRCDRGRDAGRFRFRWRRRRERLAHLPKRLSART